jgi:hypothetical protein
MEEENKISKKLKVSCSDAALLTTIKQAGDITLYQRIQLYNHNLGCSLCKLWGKHSENITTVLKSALSGENHTMSEDKKNAIKKNLDELS